MIQIYPATSSSLTILAWIPLAPLIFLVSLITLTICIATYNLYLHPLRRYPGPKTWNAFPIFRHLSGIRGSLDRDIRRYHEVYGPVVRFAPNELSFIDAQAWKDIYDYCDDHTQLQKDSFLNIMNPLSIFSSNDTDHKRFRKALSPAFSERALREQESLIKGYVDLLIERLEEIAVAGRPADMVKWYNLTTFDIIGDLAFGASFDGLKYAREHNLITTMFKAIKFVPFLQAASEFPFMLKLFVAMSPPSLRRAREKHERYCNAAVLKRIGDKSLNGRGDFVEAMMKDSNTQARLTNSEIINNSTSLILAGSETSTTLLSAVTYWLLKSPIALRKVLEEVRAAFEDESEIDVNNTVQRLPYMLACLEEALRLHPPVPTGLQRITNAGAPTTISGHLVPPGTFVGVHHSAAYWSSRNFYDPRSFLPERWLEQARTDPSSPFYNDNRAVMQPFSFGPRNCIGRSLAYNEVRLILARVLWTFELELCAESRNWAEQKSYFLWEKPELFCNLRLRHSKT